MFVDDFLRWVASIALAEYFVIVDEIMLNNPSTRTDKLTQEK